jgi:hypothetical protein
MKALFFGFAIILLRGQVEARPNYVNTYVPQALSNLGLNTTGWMTNSNACLTCHGTMTAFGDFNANFGDDFFGKANELFPGLLVANGVDDMNQTQVQQVVQALLNVDSDGDSFSNRDEFVARTNVNDGLSNPSTGGGGSGSNVCLTDPTLPQCVGELTPRLEDDSISMASSESAYQLNPGCASQEQASQSVRNLHVAGPGPIATVLGLWLLPMAVAAIRRKYK